MVSKGKKADTVNSKGSESEDIKISVEEEFILPSSESEEGGYQRNCWNKQK